MALAEHYQALKALHVGLVIASGMLFAGRGIGVMLGSHKPLAAPIRRLSQLVDTALFGSALLVLAAIRLDPFTAPWLQAKLALLLAYIFAGYVALRTAPRLLRMVAFGAALVAFAGMVAIARTKDPLAFIGWAWR